MSGKTVNRSLVALIIATTALTISFITWTILPPLAPRFQKRYGLTNLQISMVIAAPVLLGSLGRIPLGALTDRYGGRRVFTLALALQAIPLLLAGLTGGYLSLLLVGVALGLGGATFAIGIPFVSRWFPPQQQGLVLGIYGAGNIGTAIAAFTVPRIAETAGWPWAFWTFIPAVLLMALV